MLNTPGTIDSDYRGEIQVILINFGKNDYTIMKGDRIAQMCFSKVVKSQFQIVPQLNDTHRGEGGFGHSGLN